MRSFRDYRKTMANLYAEQSKPPEYTGTFTCHDCRKFVLDKDMAVEPANSCSIIANNRCRSCYEVRRQRLLAHTKRIRDRLRELKRS